MPANLYTTPAYMDLYSSALLNENPMYRPTLKIMKDNPKRL